MTIKLTIGYEDASKGKNIEASNFGNGQSNKWDLQSLKMITQWKYKMC